MGGAYILGFDIFQVRSLLGGVSSLKYAPLCRAFRDTRVRAPCKRMCHISKPHFLSHLMSGPRYSEGLVISRTRLYAVPFKQSGGHKCSRSQSTISVYQIPKQAVDAFRSLAILISPWMPSKEHVPHGGVEEVILAVDAHHAVLQMHLPLLARARHLLKLPNHNVGDLLVILLLRLAADV